jgi:hypothetical protein
MGVGATAVSADWVALISLREAPTGVSRPTIQLQTSNKDASIAHIQRTHAVRQAYKSIFSKDFSGSFITVSHIVCS